MEARAQETEHVLWSVNTFRHCSLSPGTEASPAGSLERLTALQGEHVVGFGGLAPVVVLPPS